MRRFHRSGLAGLLFLAWLTAGLGIHTAGHTALFQGTPHVLAANDPPGPTTPILIP